MRIYIEEVESDRQLNKSEAISFINVFGGEYGIQLGDLSIHNLSDQGYKSLAVQMIKKTELIQV